MEDLDKFLSGLFTKLPSLPTGVKTSLVKIAPYLAVLGVVLSLPAIFALIGFGAVLGAGWGYYGSTLAEVFAVLNVVLLALSIRGLFARQAVGWRFLYYSALVSAVYSILHLDLFSLIIGTGISLYILFQVRSYYN
jgi:hypothetical protein